MDSLAKRRVKFYKETDDFSCIKRSLDTKKTIPALLASLSLVYNIHRIIAGVYNIPCIIAGVYNVPCIIAGVYNVE